LRNQRNNFRSFIYGQSYTYPANFVKVDDGSVDVEIIGLTEITENIIKNFFKKSAKKISPPCPRFAQSGWAN